jgi:hypothetical protein
MQGPVLSLPFRAAMFVAIRRASSLVNSLAAIAGRARPIIDIRKRWPKGRKAMMEWFNRKTSITRFQIPNWGIVLGAVIVIFFIYSAVIH